MSLQSIVSCCCWFLTLSVPAILSVCKLSLHYPYKIRCLVMRIKQSIIQSNLSELKRKTLPTCLQVNYRNSLGEFSNASCGVFGAERVNPHCCTKKILVFSGRIDNARELVILI